MCMPSGFKNTKPRPVPWGCVLLLLLNTVLMAAGPDPEGLVLYLPCEHAQNPIDGSADPTTPVVEGSLSLADGQFGTRGLKFDGNNANRIAVTHAAKLEGMSALTIEAWALPQNIASHEGMSIVSKRNANQDGDAYNLFIWTGQIVEARVNAAGAINSTTALQDNTWYHIAYVFDAQANAGEKTKIYINGVLENSGDHPDGAAQGSNGGGAPLWIGELDAVRNFPWDGVLDEIGIWNIALTTEDINLLMVQSKMKLLRGDLASTPTPADGADDVLSTTDLAWAPGDYAATHNVYLGLSREDVNTAAPATLIAEGLAVDATQVDVGRLEFGQTYYWRVDEVNGAPDFTAIKGDIWSFTIEPLAYAIEAIVATSNGISDAETGLENTVNGSGLNARDEHSIDSSDMWLAFPGDEPLYLQYEFDRLYKLHQMQVWNYNVQFEPMLGFGCKDVTVDYSENGTDWTALGDVTLAQATAKADYTANTTVDFGGVSAQYVRLTVNSGWGPLGQFGLSEIRFLYIPTQARQPQPMDGTMDRDLETALAWRPGRETAVHKIYLGTEPNTLAPLDISTEPSLQPEALDFGTTYYWRVDEVNEAEVPSVWESDVWTFSTLEYATLDDFEGYNDEDNLIYETWTDGWVNETGSIVGYLQAPFAEQTIVNRGRQSMPLQYDNSMAPFYSEIEYDLGGMDLDTNGADTLQLFVAGQAPTFFEGPDGTILMNAIGVDIWGTADEFRYAYLNLSGDGTIVARIDSLVDSDVWAKAGVMIRETLEPGSTFAAVYLTGDNGVRYQGRLETDAEAVSDSSVATDEQIALREPVWVKIERVDNAFNGYYSTDGATWTAMSWNPQTIDMATDVTIGLAVTSHNSSVITGAAFAGVGHSGGVSGTWQMAEIGVAQPTSGNAIEPLYMALEDTAGNVAVVTHPNPGAVGIASWREWLIPYSNLTGINLNSIRTMFLGVGDRHDPTVGGSGTLFIDDIGFGKPAAVE